MLATSRYRINETKKKNTHSYSYKKDRRWGYLFGFWAFYIYASFFSFFFGRSVGASTKRGGDELGGPLPPWELGKRCSLFFSRFRLFLHLYFPSSSPLSIPFVRLFWRSSSCPLARAQLSPVHPLIRTRFLSTAHAFLSPAGACCFHNNRLYRKAK